MDQGGGVLARKASSPFLRQQKAPPALDKDITVLYNTYGLDQENEVMDRIALRPVEGWPHFA